MKARTIIALFLPFIIMACNKEWMPNENRTTSPVVPKIELTRSEQAVLAKDLDFGIDLFKRISKTEGYDKDLLMSPFSTSLAFSMLAAGANGDTRSQIIGGIGFKGLDYSDVASYYKKLSDGMLKADEQETLSLANAIWSECPLKDGFVSEAKLNYNAEVSYLSFSDPSRAAGIINQWTNNKTRGMIDKIVEPDDLMSAAAVLENALYFNSTWTDKTYGAKDGLFKAYDGKKENTCFFTNNSASKLISYFSDEVSVLKIPYGSGVFNFMVVLPKDGKSLDSFISSLSGEKWDNWSAACRYEDVIFEVPCFESDVAMDSAFEKALKNRGIILPFDCKKADFSKMTDYFIYIGKVIQKTSIKVSEKGTEASAATVIVSNLGAAFDEPGSTPKRFIADHPFVYAIEEASTGTLLFIGAHVQ